MTGKGLFSHRQYRRFENRRRQRMDDTAFFRYDADTKQSFGDFKVQIEKIAFHRLQFGLGHLFEITLEKGGIAFFPIEGFTVKE